MDFKINYNTIHVFIILKSTYLDYDDGCRKLQIYSKSFNCMLFTSGFFFCLLVFAALHSLLALRDLSSPSRDQTLKASCPNPWSTREFPLCIYIYTVCKAVLPPKIFYINKKSGKVLLVVVIAEEELRWSRPPGGQLWLF